MTFHTHSHPTARTAHRCSTCSRRIAPGEKYRRGFGTDDGQCWTWKDCADCEGLVTSGWLDDWMDEGYDSDSVTAWATDIIAAYGADPTSVPTVQYAAARHYLERRRNPVPEIPGQLALIIGAGA